MKEYAISIGVLKRVTFSVKAENIGDAFDKVNYLNWKTNKSRLSALIRREYKEAPEEIDWLWIVDPEDKETEIFKDY